MCCACNCAVCKGNWPWYPNEEPYLREPWNQVKEDKKYKEMLKLMEDFLKRQEKPDADV